jgi:hypothetical protein
MSTDSQSWLSNLLHVAAEESGLRGAGSETMLAKLAGVIFMEVIRNLCNFLISRPIGSAFGYFGPSSP